MLVPSDNWHKQPAPPAPAKSPSCSSGVASLCRRIKGLQILIHKGDAPCLPTSPSLPPWQTHTLCQQDHLYTSRIITRSRGVKFGAGVPTQAAPWHPCAAPGECPLPGKGTEPQPILAQRTLLKEEFIEPPPTRRWYKARRDVQTRWLS